MSDDPTTETIRLAGRAASGLLKQPRVQAVVILISVQDNDGTKFIREKKGNLHACEGLLREHLRETEQYEQGYHIERGRYDAVTLRQRRQERERLSSEADNEGEDWKDLE